MFSSVTPAPRNHGFPFDRLSLFQELLIGSEVDVGWCQVCEILMVGFGDIVFDECPDVSLGFTLLEIRLEQVPMLRVRTYNQ